MCIRDRVRTRTDVLLLHSGFLRLFSLLVSVGSGSLQFGLEIVEIFFFGCFWPLSDYGHCWCLSVAGRYRPDENNVNTYKCTLATSGLSEVTHIAGVCR